MAKYTSAPGISRQDLIQAIKRGDARAVEEMLKAGADANQTDANGVTPLMIAVGNVANFEVIRLLVDHGAKASTKDRSGKTAIDRIEMPAEPREEYENAHEAWTHCDEAFVIGYLMEQRRREYQGAQIPDAE